MVRFHLSVRTVFKDFVYERQSKVKGHYYLHLIWAIRNDKEYLIGNNHGHPNGWVSRNQIFGKVVEKL